jgi:hypothetical protein
MSLTIIEKHASCKLSKQEAALLQQRFEPCPICLQDFEPGHTVVFLPCGRPDEHSEALGHLGHSRCLRGVFRRRDSCPLCRHRLPRHDDPDLLAAQRNLDHFRLEAKRMGAAYVVPPATAQVVADGASTITSTGAADEGRRNRQIRAAAEERDDARRWRDERRRAARLRDPATMRALLTA